MQHLPKLLRNSLTWDQGAELALHKRIGASLDVFRQVGVSCLVMYFFRV